MKSLKNVHYGWYVVAASCIVSAMAVGVINNCFSQFIKPVCADMGFTRQQMSMNQTIISMVSLVFAMIWGTLSKRINLHRWMCAAAVIMPISYFCYSFSANLMMFYITSAVMGFINCFISFMAFTYIVGNWFIKDRGTAIGLSSMGSGIGAMVMNPVINALILAYGWRMTYRIIAVIIFVIVVPAVWLVVRVRPSDKGLKPYGYSETQDETVSAEKETKTAEGYSFSEVCKMPMFWMFMVVSMLMSGVVNTYIQTLSPHISDSGYTSTFAAAMASIAMGALAFGKVLLGKLFDKYGVRKAAMTSCFFTVLGLTGLILCKFPPALVLVIGSMCLGGCFGSICLPIITQTVFGMKDYNSIYGKLSAASGVGTAVAPMLSGYVYDVTGSYNYVYMVGAAIAATIIFILLKILPPKDKQ